MRQERTEEKLKVKSEFCDYLSQIGLLQEQLLLHFLMHLFTVNSVCSTVVLVSGNSLVLKLFLLIWYIKILLQPEAYKSVTTRKSLY